MVDEKIFKTIEGEEYGNEENLIIRSNCKAYINSKAKEDREKITYAIFGTIVDDINLIGFVYLVK